MTGEEIRTGIAALAVAISIVSFVITRAQARKAERFGRRPALVVRSNKQRTEWKIENIGNGPALDVILLQRVDEEWNPLRMPELPADGSAPIPSTWLRPDHSALRIRYRSIVEKERYVTRVDGDCTTMSEGWDDLPGIEEPRSYREYR